MPSQTRRLSSRERSAAKKIQTKFRNRKTKMQQRTNASRKIQSRVRGKQTRTKLINNTCSICLEPMIHNVSITSPCGHKFHSDCIGRSLTSTRGRCPNCRTVVTNIPYPSIEPEPEPEYEPLILDPILRNARQYIIQREIELLENEIEELRPQLPDPPEIPNIIFNDSLYNQYSADQTEYYARRLYDQAHYNYSNYLRLNIDDEALEQDVTNMLFITSELLTRATNNARNAQRIVDNIGNVEFAEYR
jgi:hypothetical protein